MMNTIRLKEITLKYSFGSFNTGVDIPAPRCVSGDSTKSQMSGKKRSKKFNVQIAKEIGSSEVAEGWNMVLPLPRFFTVFK